MTHSFIMCNPKFAANVGSIVRSVDLFGASRVIVANPQRVTINMLEHQATDTARVFRKRGEVFSTARDALATCDSTATIVGIELADNAQNLVDFEHPENCVYLLGAEDNGLSKEEQALCDVIVQIPCAHPWSLNVASAASIIAYDRWAKASRLSPVL